MFTTFLFSVAALAQPCRDGVCQPRSEAPHPAVVRVINERGRERTMGSGTLVAKDGEQGLIVSCGHLFREYRGQVSVVFAGGESCGARLLEVDDASDLSALLIPSPHAAPVTIASQPPRPNDALTSCGYGPDGRFAANRGRALGYVSLDGRASDVLELTGSARQGDSGGPIFNAAHELAGVLFGTDGRCVDGTHCLRVWRFLERHVASLGAAKPQAVDVAKPQTNEAVNPQALEAAKPQAGDAQPSALRGLSALEARILHLEQLAKQIEPQLAAMLQHPAAPCSCDPHLPDRVARLEALRPDSAAGPVSRVPEGAAPAGRGASGALETWLGGKLTAALVGFGIPGWIAAMATWLLLRRGRKRLKKLAKNITQPASEPIVIHDQSPPLPQVIERNREFVQVQVPTDRQTAIEWAMDEYVKRNPGARPTVETIEAYAKQFQSGFRDQVSGVRKT